MVGADSLKRSSIFEQRATTSEANTLPFETAALPHLNDLFRTATRLLGSPTEAEDVVQKTYLSAWKSFSRFEPGTNCRAWLFTIMFNAIRHHRRKWLDRLVSRDTEEVLDHSLAYTPPVPEELTDEQVLFALDAIPQQFRAALLLADVQEFSYKEVAGILSVPVGTVMSRLSRGRELLRASLGDLARSYGINRSRQESLAQA
jgi:RNA polymerase sigma-70 factor (ECF subfamily)